MPWDTQKLADEVILVSNLVKSQIALKEHATKDWKGKAYISFIIRIAHIGMRAKIIL